MEIDAKDLRPGMVVVVGYNVAKVSNLKRCTAHNKLHYCPTCKQVNINWYKTEAMASLSTFRERHIKGLSDSGKIRILHPSPSQKCPRCGEEQGFCLEHQYYYKAILG